MNPERPETDDMPALSFLAPNMGGPSLGFVTAFARALQHTSPVQVIGPDFWNSGVMPIYRGGFDYTVVPTPRLYRFPDFFWQIRRLQRAITGDVLFAFKAMPQTVWLALREKKRRGCPVVVCLDEWDGALMARRTAAERRAYWRQHWWHPLEENYYPLIERLLPRADHVISTSTFLQRKFGGSVIRMGVDTERFQPLSVVEKQTVRHELGLLPGHRVIVFGGLVRPHKGVETIVEAMRQVADPNLRLLVIGPMTETLKELIQGPGGDRLVAAGAKPAGEMPRWLGAGDVAILPMTGDLLSQSQVPCKVFEAMAMGLPILAGAVSDLPDIVSGAGEVFAPNRVEELTGHIQRLWSEPARMEAYGREARRKCADHYSAAVMAQKLLDVVRELPAIRALRTAAAG
ncbi:MAG: glycosyltransferase family 4 protein [Lentisphaerae bacterium]|nr:glycosyltransferase family 4 protein [Lentisphaerota bacterium]